MFRQSLKYSIQRFKES